MEVEESDELGIGGVGSEASADLEELGSADLEELRCADLEELGCADLEELGCADLEELGSAEPEKEAEFGESVPEGVGAEEFAEVGKEGDPVTVGVEGPTEIGGSDPVAVEGSTEFEESVPEEVGAEESAEVGKEGDPVTVGVAGSTELGGSDPVGVEGSTELKEAEPDEEAEFEESVPEEVGAEEFAEVGKEGDPVTVGVGGSTELGSAELGGSDLVRVGVE